MGIMLARLLRRLADWLDPEQADLLQAARPIVRRLSTLNRAAPRHTSLVRVLTAQRLLRMQFPTARTRDLNYAIERALQEIL